MSDLVLNPYRQAIRLHQKASQADMEILRSAVSRAVTAFSAGAWEGGQADVVGLELAAMRLDADYVASAVDHAFDTAAMGQDPYVDEGSWQIHWRNLVR